MALSSTNLRLRIAKADDAASSKLKNNLSHFTVRIQARRLQSRDSTLVRDWWRGQVGFACLQRRHKHDGILTADNISFEPAIATSDKARIFV